MVIEEAETSLKSKLCRNEPDSAENAEYWPSRDRTLIKQCDQTNKILVLDTKIHSQLVLQIPKIHQTEPKSEYFVLRETKQVI